MSLNSLEASLVSIDKQLFLFSSPFLDLNLARPSVSESRMRLEEDDIEFCFSLGELGSAPQVVMFKALHRILRNTGVEIVKGILDHVYVIHIRIVSARSTRYARSGHSPQTKRRLRKASFGILSWFTTSEFRRSETSRVEMSGIEPECKKKHTYGSTWLRAFNFFVRRI